MAFTMRQGYNAVVGVYDPVPIVLFDDDVDTFFNYRYLVKVNRRVNGAWTQVAVIKRIPNSESAGAFDISQLLRGTLKVDDPGVRPINSVTGPQSFTNNSEFFQLKLGCEKATTEGGTITTSYNLTAYTLGVAAQFGDEFTLWPYPVNTLYPPNTSSSQLWLTQRQPENFKFAGSFFHGYVVRVPYRDFRFAITYLATDASSGNYATDPAKLLVSIGNATTSFAGDSVDLPDGEQVSTTTFTPIHSSNGGCPRQLHVGYADLEDQDWASNIHGNSSYTRLLVRMQLQSNPTQVMKPWCFIFEKNECNQYGVHFKFLNKLGGYDYVFCKGHTTTDVNYTRQDYSTSTANYHTTTGLSDNRLQIVDPGKRQVVSQVTQQKPSHKAYSGYLSESENDVFIALFNSQRVYATRFVAPRTKPDDDNYYPVVIKNTRVKRMYQQTDKLVDYTIEFEYANNPRPRI